VGVSNTRRVIVGTLYTSTIKHIPPFHLNMFVPLPKLCLFFCVSFLLAPELCLWDSLAILPDSESDLFSLDLSPIAESYRISSSFPRTQLPPWSGNLPSPTTQLEFLRTMLLQHDFRLHCPSLILDSYGCSHRCESARIELERRGNFRSLCASCCVTFSF